MAVVAMSMAALSLVSENRIGMEDSFSLHPRHQLNPTEVQTFSCLAPKVHLSHMPSFHSLFSYFAISVKIIQFANASSYCQSSGALSTYYGLDLGMTPAVWIGKRGVTCSSNIDGVIVNLTKFTPPPILSDVVSLEMTDLQIFSSAIGLYVQLSMFTNRNPHRISLNNSVFYGTSHFGFAGALPEGSELSVTFCEFQTASPFPYMNVVTPILFGKDNSTSAVAVSLAASIIRIEDNDYIPEKAISTTQIAFVSILPLSLTMTKNASFSISRNTVRSVSFPTSLFFLRIFTTNTDPISMHSSSFLVTDNTFADVNSSTGSLSFIDVRSVSSNITFENSSFLVRGNNFRRIVAKSSTLVRFQVAIYIVSPMANAIVADVGALILISHNAFQTITHKSDLRLISIDSVVVEIKADSRFLVEFNTILGVSTPSSSAASNLEICLFALIPQSIPFGDMALFAIRDSATFSVADNSISNASFGRLAVFVVSFNHTLSRILVSQRSSLRVTRNAVGNVSNSASDVANPLFYAIAGSVTAENTSEIAFTNNNVTNSLLTAMAAVVCATTRLDLTENSQMSVSDNTFTHLSAKSIDVSQVRGLSSVTLNVTINLSSRLSVSGNTLENVNGLLATGVERIAIVDFDGHAVLSNNSLLTVECNTLSNCNITSTAADPDSFIFQLWGSSVFNFSLVGSSLLSVSQNTIE